MARLACAARSTQAICGNFLNTGMASSRVCNSTGRVAERPPVRSMNSRSSSGSGICKVSLLPARMAHSNGEVQKLTHRPSAHS